MPKVAVTTRSFSPQRDGSNTQETTLSPLAVRTRGIARLFSLQTQGDARGCEAQPLIIPDVMCQDGLVRDLCILATMSNTIWLFDANDGTLMGVVRLGNPIKGSRAIDAYSINQNWGVLSTPVYDPNTGMLYVVSWSSPDGTPAKSKFTMHRVSIALGVLSGSLDLSSVTYNPGKPYKVQKFAAAARKQRCGLLLSNGIVYAGFGTVAETASTAQGWVIAVDTAKWAVKGAITTTVQASGGGIWMAGQGLSADAAGNVYFMTGNGSFNGTTDFGNSFVKLGWVKGKLSVADHWTPYTDAGRVGGDPTGQKAKAEPDDEPVPTNVRKIALAAEAPKAMSDDDWSDMDLGSGGALLVEELDLILGAGKDGILYPVRMSAMGGTMPADLAKPAANYGKLASQAIWFTFYPGQTPSPMPDNVTDLNFLFAGRTRHQHSTPVYWKSDTLGHLLFTQGENSPVRVWQIDSKTKSVNYLASGAEIASADITWPPGGMPGGMMTLSANGGTGGILWVSMPYGNANTTITRGRLIAYDATTITNGVLTKLWDSNDWGIQYLHPKFNVPIAANGKLYVSTYSGSVDVYGLTPAA